MATVEALKAKIEAGEGDAETKKALGDGYSVEKNFGEALTWYTAAAEAGSAEGAYELSLLYAHGKGTTQDKVMAKKWLILAAERGSTKAQLTFSTDCTRPIMTASHKHHAVLGDEARASGALKPEDLSGCRTHLSACGLRHIPAVILTDAAAVTGQPAAQHGTERPAAREKTASEPGTIF